MGTTCLQCGCRGFTNAFVYCVKCLHVVVHRYCLDIIMDNNEFIHWVCDECKDEAQNRKSMVDRHTCVEPVIRPIWMGSFHIWNKKPSLLDGVIARVSSRACQEVYQESNQFQPVLHLEMLPKSAVWPKSFEISEPSADSIALYFFPSEISESDFDLFVDEMMHKKLAMRAFVQNAELLVFTSKDLPSLYWRFQDKYYLWGVFRGKHRHPSNSYSCREELERHMMMHGVGGCKITETMKSCDARSLLNTLRKDVSQEDKTRSRILDGWELAKPVNDSRHKAECQYCGFVSSHGGISHLRAHLGGGDPRIYIPGCCKVLPEVIQENGKKETACLRCGGRGFTNAFVYCVKCLDVAVHRYCLDVIPDNFDELIHWVCDECKDEAENKKAKVDGYTSAEPVSKPIWMGSFHISNKKPRLLDGVIAHISSRACQEVYEEFSQFQPVLQLEMLPKSAIWPKCFEISEPSSDSIALYFFPSEISELAFDLFVDEMMHKDLAMRAFVQNAELLVFASKELPSLYWRFQDKYYLWGVFRGKHLPPSHSQSCREELGKHMMMHADLFNDTGVDGCKIMEGVKSCAHTPLDTQRKDATQGDKKRSHIHDGVEQTKPVDDSRHKAECQYRGFVPSHGGISHIKAHLGGGDSRIHMPGCSKVPPEVKRIIAESVSKCVETKEAQCDKNIQVTITRKSHKRGRPLDNAWDHAIPMDDIRQGAKCIYCNFVSKRGGITRLKAHLSGGDPTRRIRGCPNVSPDIKILMEREMKKFMERPKIPFEASAKSSGSGRPLDGAWEHCITLDNIRQGAKCKYCNFVSKHGGIARLKAHLGGGDPIMRIRGCLNVSAEVKSLMAEGVKKFIKTPNGKSVGGISQI